jgi:tetratricopeptide (TPR) repeat protein
VRRLLVVAIALLVAAQVVRNSAVAALAELHPQSAASFWPGHPSVELSLGLAQIGLASRERKPVDPAAFAMIDDAARKAPLSPEPFLVHGVAGSLAGDADAAKRDFQAAQWRDPRSMPAAYFLAEHYLRSGQALDGLRQTALAARLSPGGQSSVAPFVALYAQTASNWLQIRALFQSNPTIEDGVLEALARDPDNAEAVLALADAQHRSADSQWLRNLMQSLVAAGDYRRAHAIWATIAKVEPATLLYDPDFTAGQAPPPFNWALAASGVGLAERQPGNRLHAIFYGQQDGVLASQLLLLPAGSYRLSMALDTGAQHPELLGWSVRCDKSPMPLAMTSVQAAARGWTFTIPANCAAQWLELSGRSADIAQQADVTIGRLSLARAGR